MRIAVKIAGLVITIMCVVGAREAAKAQVWSMVLIWGVPLLCYPMTLLGRRALRGADVKGAEWTNSFMHYAIGIALACGIFPAFQVVGVRPGTAIPFPRQISWWILVASGTAAMLSVANLAIRGLGAPWAIKLSSRLASDWMYRWTRNPMGFSSLVFLVCYGLYAGSLWFVLWASLIVSPAWMFFARMYEERELEIRFGQSYRDYRARTSFMIPWRQQEEVRRGREWRHSAETQKRNSLPGT